MNPFAILLGVIRCWLHIYIYIYIYIYIKIVMENEDGQLRAKENIYSKNSKIDKKFNKKRFGL